MITIDEPITLSPEYRRAVQILINNYDNLTINKNNTLTKELLITNSIQIVSGSKTIRDFPRDNLWRWNQAKARVFLSANNGDLTIKIAKYSPRRSKSKSTEPIPSLKLWHYEIIPTNALNIFHVLWCEKGFTTDNIPNTIQLQYKIKK